MSDQKFVDDIQNLGRTPRKGVGTGSTPRGTGMGSAIHPVRPHVVGSQENPESLEEHPSRRYPVDSPANTSSTQTSTQRCPVTGRPIPPLAEIEEEIDQSLILLNWHWPRSIAVKGVALALFQWACKDGLLVAERRGRLFLEDGMTYADAKNCPWMPAHTEPLTPEVFAERLGGIVDELERRRAPTGADKDDDRGDQCILPCDRDPGDGGSPGRKSGVKGNASRDSPTGSGGTKEGGRVLGFPTERRGRDGGREGLSRRLVEDELQEHQRDLRAFQEAYSCIHDRVQEVKDEGRLMKLVNWSGTVAVMGTLELSTHAIENVVSELKELLLKIDRGVIRDLDEG